MKTFFQIIISCLIISNSLYGQIVCDIDTFRSVNPGISGSAIPLPIIPSPTDTGVSFIASDEYRMVYFVHGLNGDNGAWVRGAEAVTQGAPGFQARKAYTVQPDYVNGQASLGAAITTLNPLLVLDGSLPSTYNPHRGIIIGHSQGGLVARWLDRYYSDPVNRHERDFGGLVTFATSNQGAQIINNKESIQGLLRDFGKNLSAGPKSQFTQSETWAVRVISRSPLVQNLIDTLEKRLYVNGGNFLIAENYPGITDEYTVPDGSSISANSKIPELNSYAPYVIEENGEVLPTNIVPFYAIRDTLNILKGPITYEEFDYWDESGPISLPVYKVQTINEDVPIPISWATIQYFMHKVTDEPLLNAEENEHNTALRAHRTRNDYLSYYSINKFHINELKNFRWFYMVKYGPVLGTIIYNAEKKRYEKKRDAWKKGVDFLDNFDRLYRMAIGALVLENITTTETKTYCVCDKIGGPADPFEFKIEVPNGTTNCDVFCPKDGVIQIVQKPVDKIIWRHKDSDGVVLAESAMNIPQSTSTLSIEHLNMPNSTHMRVRNDDNLRGAFEKIFKGDVGSFYYTEPK